MIRYDERIVVPAWVWVVGTLLAASLGWAFGVPYDAEVGWVVGVVAVVLTWTLLARMGGRVQVDERGLRAGRATLPVDAIGTVDLLDEDRAATLRGRDADPRAYLYLKGWVRSAVRVDVVDRSDPTPYWYVSTRRPDALADAIITARDGSDR